MIPLAHFSGKQLATLLLSVCPAGPPARSPLTVRHPVFTHASEGGRPGGLSRGVVTLSFSLPAGSREHHREGEFGASPAPGVCVGTGRRLCGRSFLRV